MHNGVRTGRIADSVNQISQRRREQHGCHGSEQCNGREAALHLGV